ncbi:hypothetical protein ACIOWF_05125 [Cellulosimicrobium cellulans]
MSAVLTPTRSTDHEIFELGPYLVVPVEVWFAEVGADESREG